MIISKEWNQHPYWFESLSSAVKEELIALYNINQYTPKQINHKRIRYNKKVIDSLE